ncbi:MAG TPA: glycosyltransferase family A protein [Candidatus Hydrogenedentes bacterium]|nr:glycosyltransferase family A protein [Candidatus Hydrogenedentota bacterium]
MAYALERSCETAAKLRQHISVVVCTYNRSDLLRLAIHSLQRQVCDGTFTYEIIIVDDASTDDSPDVISELIQHSSVPIYCVRESGKGIAAARNAGLDAASGDWIAFFDDDQLADTRWLAELWLSREMSGALCISGSRTLNLPPEKLRNMSPFVRLTLGEIPIESQPRPSSRKDTICTGNVMMHRSVPDRVGQFDPALVQGGEDTEFFMRVRKAAIDCFYTPHAVVSHMIPAYRLDEQYLVWASRRGGVCFAHRDHAERGTAFTLLTAGARLLQALFVHGVAYVGSVIQRKPAEALGRKCHMKRAGAYAVHAFRLGVARRRSKSHDRVNFRNERKLFQSPQ